MAKKKNTVTALRITLPVTGATMITGYQYGDNGTFIGVYQFEKNGDKEKLHCPPCTTLLAPPADLAVDQESYFDGQQWQVRRLTLPWLPDRALPQPEKVNHDH